MNLGLGCVSWTLVVLDPNKGIELGLDVLQDSVENGAKEAVYAQIWWPESSHWCIIVSSNGALAIKSSSAKWIFQWGSRLDLVELGWSLRFTRAWHNWTKCTKPTHRFRWNGFSGNPTKYRGFTWRWAFRSLVDDLMPGIKILSSHTCNDGVG